MKTCDEYIHSIQQKAAAMKKRRMALRSGCVVLAAVLALVLFLPFDDGTGNVSRYQDSPYYDLICGLHRANTAQPLYRNNFQKLLCALRPVDGIIDAPNVDEIPGPKVDGINGTYSQQGQPIVPDNAGQTETDDWVEGNVDGTDNQVSGVSEADLFKRSGNTIFYLRGNMLSAYSMQGEDSRLLSEVRVFEPDYATAKQMHLSADGTTLTVIAARYAASQTVVTTLDVSDPSHIVQGSSVWFSGVYETSRLADGQLLLVCRHYVKNLRYHDPDTFVPAWGTGEDRRLFSPDEICCPGDPRGNEITVVATLAEKTLEVQGRQAVLGHAGQIYVSKNAIYLSVSGAEYRYDILGNRKSFRCSYITGISYGDGLCHLGSVTVPGTVKDQYSMDEYNGTLRVAVTTSDTGRKKNCGLYIVDLNSWEIAASVESFAPAGEEVTSARFDADRAWICTALLAEFSDPVYCFDLSDLTNITWVQTPVIDGFSSSLIHYGDRLLGLGQLSQGQWKVELYRSNGSAVEQLSALTGYGWFPTDYHSYLVDRNLGIFAFPCVSSTDAGYEYQILYLDGNALRLLASQPIEQKTLSPETIRATIEGEYLYLLDDGLQVLHIAELIGG